MPPSGHADLLTPLTCPRWAPTSFCRLRPQCCVRWHGSLVPTALQNADGFLCCEVRVWQGLAATHRRQHGRQGGGCTALGRLSCWGHLTSCALPLVLSVTFLSSATTALSTHNSVFGDLKSDETELLYSAYGDETGVQCALR